MINKEVRKIFVVMRELTGRGEKNVVERMVEERMMMKDMCRPPIKPSVISIASEKSG